MTRTDSASRVIAAPPDRVYAALVDPDALAAWLPPAGMTGTFERFDARPGGSYRLRLTFEDASGAHGKTTADSDVVDARFIDMVPGVRVVQAVDFASDDPAYAGTMTMTWEVTAVDEGTRVDIRAEDVPDGISAEDHAAGLSSSLANLGVYLEQAVHAADWRTPKDYRLVPYGETNLGTPLGLVDEFVVPTDVFFVRSNYRVPTVDPATWRLRVHGLVDRELDLGLVDLRAMPQQTLVAFLECSGNSRARFEPETPGTPWQDDAIGNAVWSGVPLGDLLGLAGPRPEAVELVSQGADDPLMRRGLPLRVALGPDTLLALQMNGEDLLAAHGAPARLVVPGWGAIASTKWVTGLELMDRRWDGLWNAQEYVLIDESGAVTGRVEEMPVKSVVAHPGGNSEIKAGPTKVSGYAWSGRGQVELVEVSVDGGQTYAPATITDRAGRWAWVRWEFQWTAAPGQFKVTSRATDASGQTQPEVAVWNAKGYQMNAITGVELRVSQ